MDDTTFTSSMGGPPVDDMTLVSSTRGPLVDDVKCYVVCGRVPPMDDEITASSTGGSLWWTIYRPWEGILPLTLVPTYP